MQSKYPIIGSKEILRATFNSEEEDREKGWSVTNVSYADGYGTFNGTDSVITTNLKDNEQFLSGFTILMTVNPTDIGETAGRIFEKIDGSNRGMTFSLVETGMKYRMVVRSGGSVDLIDAADNSIVFGKKTRIAISVTAGSLANIYIDGVLSGTADQSTHLSYLTGDVPLLIGNSTAGDRTFKGLIGGIKIIKGAFSAEMAALDYKNSLGVMPDTNKQAQVLSSTNLLPALDFTSGWGTTGAASIIDSDSFSSTGDGGVQKNSILDVGSRYCVIVTGDTTAATKLDFMKYDASASYGNLKVGAGSFSTTLCFTALTSGIQLRNIGAGTTNISSIAIYKINQESLSVLADVNVGDGVISDKSGQRTITNTAVTVENDGGKYVMRTDGATSMLDLGADFIGTNDVTVYGWVNPNTYGEGGNLGRIISNGKFYVYTSNSGLLRVSSVDSTLVSSGSNSVLLCKWIFFAVTRTANGTTNFYVGDKDTPLALSGTDNQASGTPVAGTTNTLLFSNNGALTFDGKSTGIKIVQGIVSVEKLTQIWSSTRWRFV